MLGEGYKIAKHIFMCADKNLQYSVHSITRKIYVVAIDTPTQGNITLLCVGKGNVRRAYKLKRNLLLSIDFQTPSQNVWYTNGSNFDSLSISLLSTL